MHVCMLEHANAIQKHFCMFLSYVPSAASLGAGLFDLTNQGLEVSVFLPVLDMAFDLEVTVTEVSTLPSSVLTLFYCECWAPCCCTR